MIITDHLPKWLINKAKAKQIIYLYGSVDIKFRVNGLKRIRGLGRHVMDGHTRSPWKYDPFNKFAESCSPSTSLCIPPSLFFKKESFLPKVCLLQTSPCNITFLQRKEFKRHNCQLYEYKYLICSFVPGVWCVALRPHMSMQDLWIIQDIEMMRQACPQSMQTLPGYFTMAFSS